MSQGDTTTHLPEEVFTVGHSNHSMDQLLGLLLAHGITAVADVRSSPYSRYTSQFNRAPLEAALREAGIRYVFLGDRIGGRPDNGAYYDDDGHVLYGRLAKSERFREGMRRLLSGALHYSVALLCSEEDPIECHRYLLIGRVLTEQGVVVGHIRSDATVERQAEVGEREEQERTKGQLALFEDKEQHEWKSTRSVTARS